MYKHFINILIKNMIKFVNIDLNMLALKYGVMMVSVYVEKNYIMENIMIL